jgi:hypothetical protein
LLRRLEYGFIVRDDVSVGDDREEIKGPVRFFDHAVSSEEHGQIGLAQGFARPPIIVDDALKYCPVFSLRYRCTGSYPLVNALAVKV